MNAKTIIDSSKKHAPNKHRLKNVLIAFFCGGCMGLISQCLMIIYENYFNMKMATAVSLSIATIIITTSVLTGLGIYDKIAQKCGAGLFIPISGFANSLTACAMEGRSEGLIYGIGSNMFKLAGSVLTYGISSAFVFGTLRFIFFGG